MRLDHVVYFLGAGFSAPLDLPVMDNFLLKAKDLYFEDPERFGYFKDVLARIQEMAYAKNFLSLDLFNIEDVLSILEMEEMVGAGRFRRVYARFLKEVVDVYTPLFDGGYRDNLLRQGKDVQFVHRQDESAYVAFVGSLFGVRWSKPTPDKPTASLATTGNHAYTVITLNYDLVLEKSFDALVRGLGEELGRGLMLQATPLEERPPSGILPLAKLHGSTDRGIIPPTWNKSSSREVRDAWRLAALALSDATQIRFLGYSLPRSDSYVRYLLAAGLRKSKHLKQIDVICLDDESGSVLARYRELFTFYRFRFRSGDLGKYLADLRDKALGWRRTSAGELMDFAILEGAHEAFMRGPNAR